MNSDQFASESNILQQGYLQIFQQGRVVQKVFAILDGISQPIIVVDLAGIQLTENSQLKRPKAFGVSSSNCSYVEFSCPTNSAKVQWLKQLSVASTLHKQQQSTSLSHRRQPIVRSEQSAFSANTDALRQEFGDVSLRTATPAVQQVRPEQQQQQQLLGSNEPSLKMLARANSRRAMVLTPTVSGAGNVESPSPRRPQGEINLEGRISRKAVGPHIESDYMSRLSPPKGRQLELPRWIPGHYGNQKTNRTSNAASVSQHRGSQQYIPDSYDPRDDPFSGQEASPYNPQSQSKQTRYYQSQQLHAHAPPPQQPQSQQSVPATQAESKSMENMTISEIRSMLQSMPSEIRRSLLESPERKSSNDRSQHNRSIAGPIPTAAAVSRQRSIHARNYGYDTAVDSGSIQVKNSRKRWNFDGRVDTPLARDAFVQSPEALQSRRSTRTSSHETHRRVDRGRSHRGENQRSKSLEPRHSSRKESARSRPYDSMDGSESSDQRHFSSDVDGDEDRHDAAAGNKTLREKHGVTELSPSDQEDGSVGEMFHSRESPVCDKELVEYNSDEPRTRDKQRVRNSSKHGSQSRGQKAEKYLRDTANEYEHSSLRRSRRPSPSDRKEVLEWSRRNAKERVADQRKSQRSLSPDSVSRHKNSGRSGSMKESATAISGKHQSRNKSKSPGSLDLRYRAFDSSLERESGSPSRIEGDESDRALSQVAISSARRFSIDRDRLDSASPEMILREESHNNSMRQRSSSRTGARNTKGRSASAQSSPATSPVLASSMQSMYDMNGRLLKKKNDSPVRSGRKKETVFEFLQNSRTRRESPERESNGVVTAGSSKNTFRDSGGGVVSVESNHRAAVDSMYQRKIDVSNASSGKDLDGRKLDDEFVRANQQLLASYRSNRSESIQAKEKDTSRSPYSPNQRTMQPSPTKIRNHESDKPDEGAQSTPSMRLTLENLQGSATDMAEFRRLSDWLQGIGMQKYITRLFDSGVTKLSLIELMQAQDMLQIGIDAEDVPVLIGHVGELTKRTRSFSEQALTLVRSGSGSDGVDSRLGSPRPKLVAPPLNVSEKVETPFNTSQTSKVPTGRIFSSVKDIRDELLRSFDMGEANPFFTAWRQAALYMPEESVKLNPERPAVFTAHQVIEFHLHLYFAVYPIVHKRCKDDIRDGKQSLKKYLESIMITSELGSLVEYVNPNTSEFCPAAFSPPKAGAPDERKALNSPLPSSPQPAASFTRSREYAMYAGLVMVPDPQENVAFSKLFQPDWLNAVRERLVQFLDVTGIKDGCETSRLPDVADDEVVKGQECVREIKDNEQGVARNSTQEEAGIRAELHVPQALASQSREVAGSVDEEPAVNLSTRSDASSISQLTDEDSPKVPTVSPKNIESAARYKLLGPGNALNNRQQHKDRRTAGTSTPNGESKMLLHSPFLPQQTVPVSKTTGVLPAKVKPFSSTSPARSMQAQVNMYNKLLKQKQNKMTPENDKTASGDTHSAPIQQATSDGSQQEAAANGANKAEVPPPPPPPPPRVVTQRTQPDAEAPSTADVSNAPIAPLPRTSISKMDMQSQVDRYNLLLRQKRVASGGGVTAVVSSNSNAEIAT